MTGHKAIQFSIVVAVMMICYDASKLLVNLDAGNTVESKGINIPKNRMEGI